MIENATNHMNKLILFFVLSLGFTCLSQQKESSKKTLTKENENIEKVIFASMDENANTLLKDSKAYSVSIGIVKDGKTYTKHYGEIDKGKRNKADNNTLFEIASITKIFTGTLIAKAVLDGKINLDDDIRKYITGSYPNLEYHGTPISIKDLVSFKSGFDKDLPNRDEFLKSESDSMPFQLKEMEESYSKEHFFNDLHSIKLDTLPGKVYRYSNASVQLAAHILENVYKKKYETLLKENIFSQLNLKNTKLHLDKNETIANGYNENNILMPNMPNSLWGSAGFLKSSMSDITKFLSFELDQKNTIVQESQRNLLKNDGFWNGYFWDGITLDNNGLNCWKHGGAFGTQNLFAVYPEYKMGISIIVNQSGRNTHSYLYEARQSLVDDLKPFGKKSIGKAIQKKCLENISDGIAYYYQLKEKNIQLYNFLDESELNSLGYKFLKSGSIVSAIEIFKLLVTEFPNSGNAYDSLGEAYFNNKQYELSKQNYQKALELNPSNDNAKEMIKKIEQIKKSNP
nr:serine hydrolase [uncultured Flavobacterium sp.]